MLLLIIHPMMSLPSLAKATSWLFLFTVSFPEAEALPRDAVGNVSLREAIYRGWRNVMRINLTVTMLAMEYCNFAIFVVSRIVRDVEVVGTVKLGVLVC